MPWVLWTTTISFNIWHNSVCSTEAIPHPGYRQSDHAVRIEDQWTDQWVQPVVFSNAQNTFTAAYVDDDHMTGLVAYSPQPVFTEVGEVTLVNVVYKRASFTTTFTTYMVRKPKPSTWRDPETGIIYPVP